MEIQSARFCLSHSPDAIHYKVTDERGCTGICVYVLGIDRGRI